MKENFNIVTKFWNKAYGGLERHDSNSKFCIYVTCKKKHTWAESIRDIVKYGLTKCPDCNKENRIKKIQIKLNDYNHIVNNDSEFLADTHPKLVKEWHPDNELKTNEVTAGMAYRAKWKCSKSKKTIRLPILC